MLPFISISFPARHHALKANLCHAAPAVLFGHPHSICRRHRRTAGKARDPLEDCQLEIQDEMANDPNRANTDGKAGIGAEFEAPQFYFETDCSADDADAAKYKVVAGRTSEELEAYCGFHRRLGESSR